MTDRFQLVAPYQPAGDQPQAIDAPDRRLRGRPRAPDAARRDRLGQDLHDRQRHRSACRSPTLVLAPNKTLAAQLYGEFQRVLPAQRGRVLRQLLRLLPARSLRAVARPYIEKDCVDQRAHRADAAVGDQGAAVERRDAIIVATVSAIYGIGDPDEYLKMRPAPAARRAHSTSAS